MTVREKLTELMGRNIKIGGNDAAGFLFCGKVTPGLYTWLEKQSQVVYKSICANFDKAKMNYEHFDDYYCPMYLNSRNVHRLASGRPILNCDEINVARARIKDECKRKLSFYKNQKKAFKNILETDVVDTYKSILPEERGTIIVIFRGSYSINKSFWTIEECNKQPVIQRDIDLYNRIIEREEKTI